MEQLLTYYGLDWASSVIGLLGLYLVTEKNRYGFLLTGIAVIMAATVAIMAGQYGFLLANSVTFILALRGYFRWE